MLQQLPVHQYDGPCAVNTPTSIMHVTDSSPSHLYLHHSHTHTQRERERERDRQTSQVVNSQLSDQRSYRDNTANQSTSRDSTLQAREGRGEVTWFARRGAGMLWALSKRRH